MERKRRSFIIYIIYAIIMLSVIAQKSNLYVDEVYSFGLANNVGSIMMQVDSGETYFPASTPWIDYMTVGEQTRFDYKNVWINQAEDVHPPLYYVILHTICSFLPNSFSIWFAGIINIVFALGVLFFFRKLVFTLTQNKTLVQIGSVLFICSAGILSAVSFLRMYMIAMFWVTAITYFVIRLIGSENTWKSYIPISFMTIGGCLTHYYCLIYMFFLFTVYGIYLLSQRKWKEIGSFVVEEGIAVIVSVTIFPAMIPHIFSSGRGEQSVGNFMDNSLLTGLTRLKCFFDMLDNQLFGGIFIYLLFIIIAGLCFGQFRIGLKEAVVEKRITMIQSICICIPVISYFLLISKIAVYVADRYMHPIYAVLVLIIFVILSAVTKQIGNQQYLYIILILVGIMTVNGWKNANWEYLYKESESLLNVAEAYSDVDCIYVYQKPWEIHSAYNEVSKYHSVTFFTIEELNMLEAIEVSEQSRIILMITDKDEEVLTKVLASCPHVNCYEKLGGYAYTNTYYLYMNQ